MQQQNNTKDGGTCEQQNTVKREKTERRSQSQHSGKEVLMVGWKWFCEELELLKSQKKQLQKECNGKVEMGNEIWIHILGLPSQSLLCVSMGLRTRRQ